MDLELTDLSQVTPDASETLIPQFITKLYEMVDVSETNPLISWSPDGESFVITNKQKFAVEVLPKFFSNGSISTFIRQLNLYDFSKQK